MNDTELLHAITTHRMFALVEAASANTAIRAAEAAIIGGMALIEVPLSTPGSLRVISELRKQYGDRATIGAGSVVTFDQIDRAIKSGAQFISMPHTNSALIQMCRRFHVPPIVGALTPTEVATAWSMNIPMVSVFPVSSLGGPEYLRGLVTRMPGVRIGVAGEVTAEDIMSYFGSGAFAVWVGQALLSRGDIENENFGGIAERARGLRRLAGVG